jgi:hypothetical protein
MIEIIRFIRSHCSMCKREQSELRKKSIIRSVERKAIFGRSFFVHRTSLLCIVSQRRASYIAILALTIQYINCIELIHGKQRKRGFQSAKKERIVIVIIVHAWRRERTNSSFTGSSVFRRFGLLRFRVTSIGILISLLGYFDRYSISLPGYYAESGLLRSVFQFRYFIISCFVICFAIRKY